MTKAELLKKNQAIKLAREAHKDEVKIPEPMVLEEEGKREEMVELELENNQPELEENKEEQPKKRKGGRKPANREYMVVEDVGIQEENANIDAVEEDY